jgi:hypothetical protein
MLYSDEFIDTLRDDPVPGSIALCDRLFDALRDSAHEGWIEQDFTLLLEAYALMVEVIESQLLPITISYPSVSGAFHPEMCAALYQWFQSIKSQCEAEQSKLRVASLRSRFRAGLGRAFAYEFSQGDLERVQELVNQLRTLISESNHFEKEHQQRLLRRLEKLQGEMHKRVSDLDRFWGLVGDAGVVVGKLGNDAKPIVDRIREIADIVWQTQSRAEELPSGTKLPQLENKPADSSEA